MGPSNYKFLSKYLQQMKLFNWQKPLFVIKSNLPSRPTYGNSSPPSSLARDYGKIFSSFQDKWSFLKGIQEQTALNDTPPAVVNKRNISIRVLTHKVISIDMTSSYGLVEQANYDKKTEIDEKNEKGVLKDQLMMKPDNLVPVAKDFALSILPGASPGSFSSNDNKRLKDKIYSDEARNRASSKVPNRFFGNEFHCSYGVNSSKKYLKMISFSVALLASFAQLLKIFVEYTDTFKNVWLPFNFTSMTEQFQLVQYISSKFTGEQLGFYFFQILTILLPKMLPFAMNSPGAIVYCFLYYYKMKQYLMHKSRLTKEEENCMQDVETFNDEITGNILVTTLNSI